MRAGHVIYNLEIINKKVPNNSADAKFSCGE